MFFNKRLTDNKLRIAKLTVLLISLLFILFWVLPFFLEMYISKKIESKIPSYVALKYNLIEVSAIDASIAIRGISVDMGEHGFYKIPSLVLSGIDVFKYLRNDHISIQSVLVDSPKLTHKLNINKEENNNKLFHGFDNTIEINVLRIKNGNVVLMNNENSDRKLMIDTLDIMYKNMVLDKFTDNPLLPLFNSANKAVFKNIYLSLNRYEDLNIAALELNNKDIHIKDFSILTSYSKHELSNIISKERDHIQLTVPKIVFKKPHFRSKHNKLLFSGTLVNFNNPTIKLYRDKRVRDDHSYKKLFGTMLKEIPFNFKLDTLHITNGFVSYKERLEDHVKPEELFFSRITINSYNFSNTAKKIMIGVTSSIMGQSDLSLDCSFSILEDTDNFLISGFVKDFNAASINSFLRTNTRSQAKGILRALYFTSSGNSISATGHTKVRYNDFEFKILKKDRLRVNKLLTAIGNIFVDKDSDDFNNDYRFGKIDVERDVTKSFFNYLWLQVKNGLISALTGSGKKE